MEKREKENERQVVLVREMEMREKAGIETALYFFQAKYTTKLLLLFYLRILAVVKNTIRYKDRRLVRSAAVQGLSRFASDIIIRGFDTPAKVECLQVGRKFSFSSEGYIFELEVRWPK